MKGEARRRVLEELCTLDPRYKPDKSQMIDWSLFKINSEIEKVKKWNTKMAEYDDSLDELDNTKLSAFFMIFDLTIVNLILNNTNKNAQKHEPYLKFTREDILAFICVLFVYFSKYPSRSNVGHKIR